MFLFLFLFSLSLSLSLLNSPWPLFLQEVEQQLETWEGYVDWRNKPALRGRHGGMLAASFVLGKSKIRNQ